MLRKSHYLSLLALILLAGCARQASNQQRVTPVPVVAPAPAAAPAVAPSQSTANDTEEVHVTMSGTKYHRAGCRHLLSDRTITLKEARAKGYTPCSVCAPPQ